MNRDDIVELVSSTLWDNIADIINYASEKELYIVLEGPDAVGKTTIAEILTKIFSTRCSVTYIRQPNIYRDRLLHQEMDAFECGLTFLMDQELSWQSRPFSSIYIGDRSANISTLVYQLPHMGREEAKRFMQINETMKLDFIPIFITRETPLREKDQTVFEQEQWENIANRYDYLSKMMGAYRVYNLKLSHVVLDIIHDVWGEIIKR